MCALSETREVVRLPKPLTENGRKNLISENLIALRRKHKLSQRDLARLLQLAGCDMDRNAKKICHGYRNAKALSSAEYYV